MSHLVGWSEFRAQGRHREAPSLPLLNGWTAYHYIAPFLTIVALFAPAGLLTGPTMITVSCAALLVGGLPHGALDLAILHRDAQRRTALVIALYLGLATMMFAAWQLAPPLALAIFLTLAMAHFAEDWSAAEHPFFALSIAAALVAAPTLFHHDAVGGLFVLLTGTQAASDLADPLLLIAPAASACAMLAILLLWRRGDRWTASNAACALAAMTILPPVTGFAIYFCLIHSPTHFRAGLAQLTPATGVAKLTIAATFGGLAIALLALQFVPNAAPSGRILAASFMTLSILTLPHIAMPLILRGVVSSRLRCN